MVLAQQRQSAILEQVTQHGGVRVADLVRGFGVSDMTIRRDIEVARRTGARGKGARRRGRRWTAPPTNPAIAAKSTQQRAEKLAIARAAAALVQPGQAIGMSAGTTTAALARELLDIPELTVVTNSIPVADAFYQGRRPDQTVVLTGGTRTPSDALVGPVAETALASSTSTCSSSACTACSPRTGFTTPNLAEADINRALLGAARQVVVLADHTKWDLIGIATIAPLTAAHVLSPTRA